MSKSVFTAIIFVSVLVLSGTGLAEDVKVGAMSGQLMIKGGGPLSGAIVFLYNTETGPPPSHNKYWRVPDVVGDADDRGRFSTELVEGTYCVGAIKRAGKRQLGPPFEGDYFILSLDEKGAPKKYQVKKGEKLDIGVLSEAVPYKKADVKEGITAVEGYVLDGQGRPVEGALVFAFATSTIVGKPLFVSERTAKDGKYLLRVHEGGSFYLKIRSTYGGGPPVAHEVLDSYVQEPAALLKVTVKTGEIAKGINLKGMEFPGRGSRAPEVQPFVNKGGELKR